MEDESWRSALQQTKRSLAVYSWGTFVPSVIGAGLIGHSE